MSTTYSDKLKDPRWQKRRLEIMQLDDWKCFDCGDSTGMLSVHHNYYVKGRSPWEYEDGALLTLCESCHSGRHDHEEVSFSRGWETLLSTLRDSQSDLVGFACAIHCYLERSGLSVPEAIESLRRTIELQCREEDVSA